MTARKADNDVITFPLSALDSNAQLSRPDGSRRWLVCRRVNLRLRGDGTS